MSFLRQTFRVTPLILFVSCAGPTNPWGNYGLSLPTDKFAPETIEVDHKSIMNRIPQQESNATIDFYPKKQNVTELTDFTLIIDNKKLIERDFKLKLFYNQYDVTDSWLRHAKLTYNSKFTKVKIAFSGLKLLADKEHDILVKFQNDIYTTPRYYRFEEPQCELSAYSPLEEVSPFEIDELLTRTIENISKENNVNPRFVAGLIAQESAFNSKAISKAKALGLTQITNLAQSHILEEKKKWPTHSAISEYSVPIIKTMILTGAINPKNEWRLNEEYSIEGGITFLKYLENYWFLPENRKLVQEHYGNNMDIINDLILASYNSGAYRVKIALKKYGRAWKKDSDELNEARKYIRKVKSYCYHFEKEEPLSIAQMDL